MYRFYDYACEGCGAKFEAIVRQEERDAMNCPTCDARGRRLAPRVSVSMGALSRKTMWDAKQDANLAKEQDHYFAQEQKKGEAEFFEAIGP